MKKIIEMILATLVVIFSMLNIMNYFEVVLPALQNQTVPSQYITFDLGQLFYKQNRIWFWLTIFFIVSLIVARVGINISQNSAMRKKGYDKKSYGHLLTKFERRRGTVMMKYLDREEQGRPTEKGLIKKWYRFKTPFAKQWNKLASHFLLPATSIWNEVKTDSDGKEIPVGGVPVMAMRKYGFFGKFDKLWYLTGNIHSLFVGSTGRGKTMSFVLPMIYSYINAGESVVVHDPKREIDAYTRKALEDNGYDVYVIDFVEPQKSDGWNPFALPYKKWKEAIDKELATWYYDEAKKTYSKNVLITDSINENGEFIKGSVKEVTIPEDLKYKEGYKYANLSEAVELTLDVSNALTWEEDSKDPFWSLGAGDMVAGGALFAMEEGIDEYVNSMTIRYLIELGDDVDDKGIPLLKKYLMKYRDINAESRRKFATYLNAAGNTAPSLKAVFSGKTVILASNKDIVDMLAHSSFDMEEVFKKKTAIFLKTHDEKSTYYPLVTLFLKQLYEVGIKVSRQNENRELEIPQNWVIDEMGLLPEIKDIEAIYGAARSRRVRINAFVQTFEQLEDKYEEKVAKIIEDNSTNVIYLGSQSVSTRERFSELAGNEIYWDRKSKEYKQRPIITPERLKSFEKGRSLINTIEWNSFIAKLPPATLYNFIHEPNWESPYIDKPEAQYFNIRNAWAQKNGEESLERSERHSAKGGREFRRGFPSDGITKSVERSKDHPGLTRR